ncbi:C4-type zinc ribbon domain-containing protein [Helicobacter sp. 11S02629-2]|uniref:zinc ribbon domain-containing protein n=1 Tax=Helicobacter sp. 11S02629-2 TaxID=1476195 RepID=UPI000BA5EF57|nr:C4-type zinc ribbon domain-containing protein [Helicobacter sp. 11S02629-2]PAF42158.1 hypothetical protein BKH40_08075 [Helicobacter sp. 11S02629-2]
MNINLSQLISISQLDKEIDALSPAIEAKRSTSLKLKKQEEKYLKEIEDLNAKIEDANIRIARNEQSLKEHEEALEANLAKAKAAKSDKDLKNMQIDDDLSREQIERIAAEQVELDKRKIEYQESINTIQKQITNLVSDIQEAEETINNDIEEIKKKQAVFYNKKQEIIMKIDKKILSFYEKIKKWAGNTSVVQIKRNACGGCFMKLSDKVCSEVMYGDSISTCPHCGRILYAIKERETETAK